MNNKKASSKLLKQEVIVFLVVVALLIFFCAASPDFRKYTTILTIMDYSYYIVLMAIGVAFPLITGGVDLSIGTGLVCYSLAGGYLITFSPHCSGRTCVLAATSFSYSSGLASLRLVCAAILNTLNTDSLG